MIEYDSLEEFRDPQTYDLVDEGYYDERRLAARPSDHHFSRDDLCLPATELACRIMPLAESAPTNVPASPR